MTHAIAPRPVATRNTLCATFPYDGPGTYEAEVMLEGPSGPEVAGLRSLYVEVPVPKRPVVAPESSPATSLDPVQGEERLVNLINEARRKQGARPLILWPPLVREARAHSTNMREAAFFGHHSKQRGTTEERLEQLPVSFKKAGENVAKATSVERAHAALMASPSHRNTLLEPTFTHLGVGVVVDAQSIVYVTEIFVQSSDSGPPRR
jgi:uncharacterized protein YkwD